MLQGQAYIYFGLEVWFSRYYFGVIYISAGCLINYTISLHLEEQIFNLPPQKTKIICNQNPKSIKSILKGDEILKQLKSIKLVVPKILNTIRVLVVISETERLILASKKVF